MVVSNMFSWTRFIDWENLAIFNLLVKIPNCMQRLRIMAEGMAIIPAAIFKK